MFEVYDVAIIPLIIAMVGLFRSIGVPKSVSPVIAVICGLAAGIFYVGADVKEGIIVGLMLGLSATGLYSGTKNAIEDVKKGDDQVE